MLSIYGNVEEGDKNLFFKIKGVLGGGVLVQTPKRYVSMRIMKMCRPKSKGGGKYPPFIDMIGL